MPKVTEIARSTFRKSSLLVLVGVTTVSVSAMFLLPNLWPVWTILVATTIGSLAAWHNTSFGYRCRHCGHEFEISLLRNLVSPHIPIEGGGEKYLSCAACGTKDWTTIIPKAG